MRAYVLALVLPLFVFAENALPAEQQKCSSFFFDSEPRFYPSICLHRFYAVHSGAVEMEDGTTWTVSPQDWDRALQWRAGDIVVISKNDAWFSRYDYKLFNRTLRTTVYANLSLGPLVNGALTRYVAGLDQGRGEVILSDNSRWEISRSDLDLLSKWILDDAVLIGINTEWGSKYEVILINVNLNRSVRANLF